MSSFSDTGFAKKLKELNNTQQSIQTLSLWLIHHRKHASVVVKTWLQELRRATPDRRLLFMYLANDVIQNSRKKGSEYNKKFKSSLPDAFKYAAREADDTTRLSLERLISIWKDRSIYTSDDLHRMKVAVSAAQRKAREKEKQKMEKLVTEAQSLLKTDPPNKNKKKKKDITLLEEIELDLQKNPDNQAEPPDAEELVKALRELEDCASCDAAVRQRIAAFPNEVSDSSALAKLQSKAQAEELSTQVEEACLLLANYNARLQSELEERKQVAKSMRHFIQAQNEALQVSKERLEEYKEKKEKITMVREELKSHMQALPDLTLLPDVTAGGLAPLPAAGDLFGADK